MNSTKSGAIDVSASRNTEPVARLNGPKICANIPPDAMPAPGTAAESEVSAIISEAMPENAPFARSAIA